MLSQQKIAFCPHYDLFQAGFEHDRDVYDQVRDNKAAADITNLVLSLNIRDKVRETHHRIHDEYDHNFIKCLHSVDWRATLERSQVANIHYLGYHSDFHNVDLNYNSSVVNYSDSY